MALVMAAGVRAGAKRSGAAPKAPKVAWWEADAPYTCKRCGDPCWFENGHPCCALHNASKRRKCPACEASKTLNRRHR